MVVEFYKEEVYGKESIARGVPLEFTSGEDMVWGGLPRLGGANSMTDKHR
jgi:hypothetical protein